MEPKWTQNEPNLVRPKNDQKLTKNGKQNEPKWSPKLSISASKNDPRIVYFHGHVLDHILDGFGINIGSILMSFLILLGILLWIDEISDFCRTSVAIQWFFEGWGPQNETQYHRKTVLKTTSISACIFGAFWIDFGSIFDSILMTFGCLFRHWN